MLQATTVAPLAEEPRGAELDVLLERPRVAAVGDERDALRLALGEGFDRNGLDPAPGAGTAQRRRDDEPDRRHGERAAPDRAAHRGDRLQRAASIGLGVVVRHGATPYSAEETTRKPLPEQWPGRPGNERLG